MPRKKSAKSASKRAPDPAAAARAADELFQTKAFSRPKFEVPAMSPGYGKVVERVFSLDDPADEFEFVVSQLAIEDAVTPERVQEALNEAEDTARRAHRLYVCTKVDNDRYEIECDQVMGVLRDAANAELQAEKDAKKRSKAITDADVRERIAGMYPDEWSEANERRAKAKGMLDHVKRLANLWEGRCYTLSTMAGRRKRSF